MYVQINTRQIPPIEDLELSWTKPNRKEAEKKDKQEEWTFYLAQNVKRGFFFAYKFLCIVCPNEHPEIDNWGR